MSDDFYRRSWEILQTEPLEALRRLGGYYECPKDNAGKRLGPLVGYAGKYDGPGGTKLQYVGDVYANFAKAEEYPRVYMSWAEHLKFKLGDLRLDVVLGMPMGGISVAFALAPLAGSRTRFCFAEKQITAVATATLREQSRLVLARHELPKGARVGIGEDVTNNLSTAGEAIRLILEAGAEPVSIISWLNRSPAETYIDEATGLTLPITSLIWKPFPQYRQDDPAVIDDIAAGNVALKPKNEWPRLMQAMQENRPVRKW